MKRTNLKKVLTLATAIMCILAVPASAKVSSNFLKSSVIGDTRHIILAGTDDPEDFDEMDITAPSKSPTKNMLISTTVSASGSTVIVTAKSTKAYMVFALSEGFIDEVKYYGGTSLRFDMKSLAIEYSVSSNPTLQYTTMIYEAPIAPKSAVSDAYGVSVGLGSSSYSKFVLRFKLTDKYNVNKLKLVESTDTGWEDVSTTLKMTKSDDAYYVRTGNLTEGIYALVTK